LSRSARHTFILIVVTLSGCLAAFGGWRFAKASAPVNGPIVLLSIDALRADRVGAYGDAAAKTPSIDRLAKDGILFERAYAHVPQTLPSHVALLTGRLPFESGVRDGAGFRVSDDTRTIAELLRDRGYATGGIVSSFLLRKDTGIARGFTFFDSELPAAGEASPQGVLSRDGADSEQIAEHWLDSAGTSRAFLFLHIAEPHAPYTARERFKDLDPYDAEVAYADEIVGRLVRYLKAHQLYDRSTILLTADHGEGLGDHGEREHGLLAYEETLRVPLIVKPPAGDGSAQRVKAPVQHADIVPTILDLAKAPGGSGLRGRSLTPFFTGGTVPDADIYAESLFGQYRFGWPPIRSVIRGSHQLVSNGSAEELFDLADPAATRRDIAEDHPEVVADLRKRLTQFTARTPTPAPGPVTSSDRERYEALGYVGLPGAAIEPDESLTERAAQVRFVEEFRDAVRLSRDGEWQKALERYRGLTREHPRMVDLWLHLAQTAARGERQDIAIDAYRQALTLAPRDTTAYLGAAASSLRGRKIEDAAQYAQAVLDTERADAVQKAEAHEILARVALNRREVDTARDEAVAAEAADPRRPVRAFIEGRIAMEQGRFADAVASFDEALAAARKAGRAPLADLRVFAAESMLKVNRADDAERLLQAEIAAFPANARARSALQTLYRQTGRADDAAALAQH
jgi:arylsulfatase A-like enzyme/cytochrome c-type biogenesis protein CcmH/NrfG